jgi:hypothetical protein
MIPLVMVAGSHNNVTDTQLGWMVVSPTHLLLLTSLSGLVVLLLYKLRSAASGRRAPNSCVDQLDVFRDVNQ